MGKLFRKPGLVPGEQEKPNYFFHSAHLEMKELAWVTGMTAAGWGAGAAHKPSTQSEMARPNSITALISTIKLSMTFN